MTVADFVGHLLRLGVTLWVMLLSVLECGITHLDKSARANNSLFVKDTIVGLGAAMTVILSRTLPIDKAIYVIAGLGIFAILSASVLYQRQTNNREVAL